ncbi:MAG: hypothetical protein ACE5EO_00835 [Candidatus Krumholzibacteriia bacterium]
MRIFRSTLAALLLLAVCVGLSQAQTPTVRLYFDTALTAESKNCPPAGGLDSMFVVAQQFNDLISGLELAVTFPVTMTWVADAGTPPVTFGTSPTGISMGWSLPQNVFGKFRAYTILFTWNCSGCSVTDTPVVVSPHPIFGAVRATQWPTNQFINAIGMTGLICATVPVEDTTWGRVKALYTAAP